MAANDMITFGTGATRSANTEAYAFDLVCPQFIGAVAYVLAGGAQIHGRDNWTWGLPIADCINHFEVHWQGWKVTQNPEDLAHAIANLMFIYHYATCCDCHAGRARLAALDQTYLAAQEEEHHGRAEPAAGAGPGAAGAGVASGSPDRNPTGNPTPNRRSTDRGRYGGG